MRSHVFSLCPDSHFAHEQFRNCTAQNKNSYFARQSENSHFAQDNSGIVPILTLRKVRIGTIPELSCAKWEFSLCPPIPELYRTILELRKGYMLKIGKICVPAQSGNSWTKWEFVKRRDSSWNKTEKCVMRKRFECLLRKTDYSNNIAT